jgi:tRNA1Val (adenine37-N6)-methyltransferase
MANIYFNFKQFTVSQEKTAFKVGTDGVILGAYADITDVKRILDIGTGTGLIALMLAQRCNAEIVALEPDRESFLEASENVKQSKWSERICIEKCLLQDYSPGNPDFDLIVTNPPYFIDSMKNPDPVKSNARHNDILTHAHILSGVRRLLKEDGKLFIILSYPEGNVFIAEAQENGLYCNRMLKIKSVPTSGIKRLVLGFSRKKTKVNEKFLTIEKGKRHEFTEDYKNLTKDFYLKF